jgi:hypothetical protein
MVWRDENETATQPNKETNMYQPGMTNDRQLAQIRYQDALREAADARADRQTHQAEPRPNARKLVLALAGAAPVALWVAWMLIGR